MSLCPAWIQIHEKNLLLRLYIQPGARKSEISGEYGTGDESRLKIRIAAPPVEGAANEAVLAFLAQKLGLRKSQIELLRGDTSRNKDVIIATANWAEVERRLQV